MHPHRRSHFRAEILPQPGMAETFVARIDAPVRHVLRHIMQQVADIVQQCSDHQPCGRAFALRVIGGLQRVLQLRDRLAEIRGAPLSFEDFNNAIADLHGCYTPCATATRRWPINSSAAAPLESNATPASARNAPVQPKLTEMRATVPPANIPPR